MPEPTTTDDTTATGQTGADDRASVSDEARGSEPRALTALLADSSIVLDAAAVDRDDAIRQAGAALIAAGAVRAEYVDGMLERERSVSTYVGEGIAVPHGTRSTNEHVLEDAIVVLRFADGIEWDGHTVTVVIGLASHGMGHIALLAQLAAVLLEPERAEALRSAASPSDVVAVLGADVATPAIEPEP
jgi:PTS system mannitol-specific IIA component